MKLVIDIPAETYSFVKQLQWVSMGRGSCKTIQQTVINSIKFGVKYPQGNWIRTELYGQTCYECDNCHLHYDLPSNFCSNCGAKCRQRRT